jgi:hypothetical protein
LRLWERAIEQELSDYLYQKPK